MPDYTANRIMIRGSQGELDYARNVLGDMDFEKILPCPETLMIESGTVDRIADLAFLYTIYGDDPEKAIQNGKSPQMINVMYPTWKKNYAEDIRWMKECVMTDFPEDAVIDPDAGRPFGQESSDISYLWGKGHKDSDGSHDGADFVLGGGITVVSDYEEDGASKTPRSRADLAALGRIRYMNYLRYGYTDWHGWRDRNWGVKWNAVYPEVAAGDGFVSYGFGTPWNIPDGIYRAFAKLLAPTGLEVVWAYAFEQRGYDCGYFVKKSNENEFDYIDKEGDAAFADSIWERDDWFHVACAAE